MDMDLKTRDEVDLGEVAAVVKRTNPLAAGREIAQIEAALDAIQERHPSDFILEAREEGILIGWLSFRKTTATMGEMGRWQPHVLNVSAKETVFCRLLHSLTDEAGRRGIRRIEVGYGRISVEVLDIYDERAAWLEAEGFHKLEDNLFMACSLSGCELTIPPLPDTMTLQCLSTVPSDDLFRCYAESFSDSEHRQFFDFTPGPIREAFDGYFDLTVPYDDDASLVLAADGRVVGFSLIRPRTNEAHLEMFGLHPDFRGMGLGKTLLRTSMRTVFDEGTERMTLGVDAVNVPAVALYEKTGFERVSRMVVHSWKHDD